MLSRQRGHHPGARERPRRGPRPLKAREKQTGTILVNLSGRGDKDIDYVIEHWGTGDGVH